MDWDSITVLLDRNFQKRWIAPRRKITKTYRNKSEVGIILRKYHSKLYTFLSLAEKYDKRIRDVISIALVRIAQKGNVTAKQEVIRLISFTVDDWIEYNPKISCWRGYDCLIRKHIEGCIRRYRYSGTFIGYVFKTLEYAGRGLMHRNAYSLDDPIYAGEKSGFDGIGQNPETGKLSFFGRNIDAL